jgi:hypothetical protein
MVGRGWFADWIAQQLMWGTDTARGAYRGYTFTSEILGSRAARYAHYG